MPKNDNLAFGVETAPTLSRRPHQSGHLYWTKRVFVLISYFAVGAGLGFIGGLAAGSITLAVVIGCLVGGLYLVLRVRFGHWFEDPIADYLPDQVGAQEKARVEISGGIGR